MDASRYFYQQLSGRFFRIAFLSIFLFSAITALLVLRNNQVTSLVGKELPSLTIQKIQQQQLLTIYLALEDSSNRNHADTLFDDYENVQKQINEISSLIKNNKSKLDLMYVGHKEFVGIIETLTKNNDRNNQLKQNTIIQLQLINDQLSFNIKEKKRQTTLLLKQINLDRFTDKVTANRSKAYAKQITELSHLHQLQQTIIRALLAFQQLDLQYSILEFDDVSTELKQTLKAFIPEVSLKNTSASLLTDQLVTLDQLLFSQQNSVAKWRSHLRLARTYVEFIELQQQKLQKLVFEISAVNPSSSDNKILLIDWVPSEVIDFLAKQNITLNNHNLQLVILSLITLLFLMLLKLIFGTKKIIKNYGQNSVQLFTQFIGNKTTNSENESTPDIFNSMENKKIAEQFQTALEIFTTPEHSEKEYQQQLEEQQTANQNISQKVEEIQELKAYIDNLDQVTKKESLQRNSKDAINNEKLSNMVVRTMLQSQSVSIGSGVTSLQVYRQLARIFDWCRQNKIRSEFSSTLQSMTLIDVSLHNEIDAALLNIITDAHFQRNKIYYQQDEQLLTHAKVDIRLFQRLLNGICRLLLIDLFKANLQIHSFVIDKNDGQQIVRFDFSVTTNKTIVQVPDEIERLLLVERPESEKIISNDTLDYLCILFDSLNVTDKNVQLQDHGYLFSFTLPIAIADVTPDIPSQKIDLHQASIILLSNDKNTSFTIQKAISSANGILDILSKPELIVEKLTNAHLSDKKVDLVIVGSDFYAKSFEKIQQHIATLDKNIRPKLFVMQPYFNAPLERHGLFKQAANPLKSSDIQQSLANFLTADETINLALDASKFSKHQYLVTQVEVLFAIKNPTEHLLLLRILQWLGLQVKVVCQAKAMAKFWSSGRYLLLFTEFELSPFIEMAAGKGVRRDIFTFHESSFSTKDSPTLAEKWGVSVIPELDNTDALVTLLQPWLKPKRTKVIPIEKIEKSTVLVKKPKTTDTGMLDANVQLGKIPSNVGSSKASEVYQQSPLDLDVYARNQGSAELAVIMIDDYLIEIEEATIKLFKSLEVQNYQLCISLTNNLIKVGTILAAQDFTDTCQHLLDTLKQDKKLEHQKIMVLFGKLSHEKLLLNQFAEAI
jgi:hypothetical protein